MLMVNQLIGFGAGGQTGPVTATYASGAASGTDTNSYSFAGQNIGTAAADRLVVVCAIGNIVTTAATCTGVTIGGNAATLYGTQVTDTPRRPKIAWAGLNVAAGTTATIVTNWSNTMEEGIIHVWAVTGAGLTFAPHHHVSNTGGGVGLTGISANGLTVPEGGAVLAVVNFVDTTAGLTGVAFTGPTEVADIGGGTANSRLGAASLSNQAAQSLNTSATANLDADLGAALSVISLIGV